MDLGIADPSKNRELVAHLENLSLAKEWVETYDSVMIEVEFYAPGLREEGRTVRFGQELETRPEIRYKIDTNHDIVYFELTDPDTVTLSELRSIFRSAGLVARLVGEKPEEMAEGKSGDTQKLSTDTQKLDTEVLNRPVGRGRA